MVRRAISKRRGGIAAAEGIRDRGLKQLEASLAGIAERHSHHSEAVSHRNTTFRQGSSTSGIIIIFGVLRIANKRSLHSQTYVLYTHLCV